MATISKAKFGLIAAVALSALASCSYQKEKIPATKPGSRILPPELLNSVSFSMVKTSVFDRYNCTGCHADRGDIDFGSYEATKANLAKIATVTLNTKTMPKNGSPLSSADEDILYAWVQMGGRFLSENEERAGITPPIDNPPGPVVPPIDPPIDPPVAVDPTFKSITENIFTRKKCDDCHIPGGSGEDVDLYSIQSLLDPINSLVVPFDPDKSVLIKSVSPGARRPMPPKRPKYTPLTESEINVIKEWIKNGAKD